MVDLPSSQRVVITGMGVVCSLGDDVDGVWRALLEGRSGIGPIRLFDAEHFPINVASEVRSSSSGTGPDPGTSRSKDFAIRASRAAWAEAGLDRASFDPHRAGVCLGCSDFPTLEDRWPLFEKHIDRQDVTLAQYYEHCSDHRELLPDPEEPSLTTFVSSALGLRGVSMGIQGACTSGTQAIGEAVALIRRGRADIILSGGADSLLSVGSLAGFTLLGALSSWKGPPEQASRPFDRKRSGFVLGEGSGIVVVERLDHALERGAPIVAELAGYGSSSDGFRFTDVHPKGLGAIRCMTQALESASVAPEEVGYINAHGTGTQLNDRVETLAIKKTFGDHAHHLLVSSTKSQLGHLICAAGGIEAIFTALTLARGTAPPTINLEYPDPHCDLNYVPLTPTEVDTCYAMSNSFGFGGQNGSLLLRRWAGS